MNPHIVQYFMSIWGCQNPLSCTVCFLVTCQCMTAGDGSVSKRTLFGPGLVHWLQRDSLQPPSLPKSSFTPALPSCPQVPSLALPGCAGLQHSWELAAVPWASSMGHWRIPGAGEIPPSLPLFQAQFCSLPGSTSYFSSLPMAKATWAGSAAVLVPEVNSFLHLF